MPHAVIDLDELRRGWPPPRGDRFHGALVLTNLRDVSQNYMRAGARRLIMAGVVEERGAVEEYATAVGMPVTVCRLRVDLDRVTERLVARHGPGPALEWHLRRSGELESILEGQSFPDVVVDVGNDSLASVSTRVLAAIGWD